MHCRNSHQTEQETKKYASEKWEAQCIILAEPIWVPNKGLSYNLGGREVELAGAGRGIQKQTFPNVLFA